MDQDCAQTWLTSMTEGNKYYVGNARPYLQLVTWNDYNEGTEIESGIDNCYIVGASLSGNTLNWSLNPTNSSLDSLTTVSHVEIYDSPDGTNLTLVASPKTASSGNVQPFHPALRQPYDIRSDGRQKSILNRIYSGVHYTN